MKMHNRSTNKWILLVDDDPLEGEILRRCVCASAGWTLVQVSAPDQIKGCARPSSAPLVVLLDVQIPKWDLPLSAIAVRESVQSPIIIYTGIRDPAKLVDLARSYPGLISNVVAKGSNPLTVAHTIRATAQRSRDTRHSASTKASARAFYQRLCLARQ